MSITEEDRIVVATDADGGLRISPSGALAGPAVAALNQTIAAGLRAGPPRVEIDLRAVTSCDNEALRVLDASSRIARHLRIELRVTGGAELGVPAA